jgi:hypothetical protein
LESQFWWWIRRAHFEICYMVTEFTKRMLRATGMAIRIERLMQEFLCVENLVKRRKYPIRISGYVI